MVERFGQRQALMRGVDDARRRREVFSPCINSTGILRPPKSAQVTGSSDPPAISVKALSRDLCRSSSFHRAQVRGCISINENFQTAIDVSLVKPRLDGFCGWGETRAIVAGRWLLQQRTERAFHQNQLLDERRSCLSCPHYHRNRRANDQPDRPDQPLMLL